jgi:hypothetical protein
VAGLIFFLKNNPDKGTGGRLPQFVKDKAGNAHGREEKDKSDIDQFIAVCHH